jgi:hypothetical protein
VYAQICESLREVSAAERDGSAAAAGLCLSRRRLCFQPDEPDVTTRYAAVRSVGGSLLLGSARCPVNGEPNPNYAIARIRPEAGAAGSPVLAGALRGYRNAPLPAASLAPRGGGSVCVSHCSDR